ncbi:MAG TPA: c-type cytochrome biogenesis protein CcmI [Stellaceae bacterium]|jgi:cytochrome c-type biogenesis protein CcmH|nr:c-type cytochrome biogenesis protein CcmI [Stellaceae bacterium]
MEALLLIGVLAVLVVVILLFVFVPLARGRAASAKPRGSFARAVYRDQLTELGRDRERGTIDAARAEASRREIERRLLASDQEPDAASAKPRPVLAAVLAFGTLLVAMVLYAVLGNPGLPDRPYADRQAERAAAVPQMPRDLNKAVAGLQAKLKADPNNLDGWILLGRTEAVRQHWEKSAEAMRHAASLAPKRADLVTAYGEVQVLADGGLVTPRARDAFSAALALEPKDLQALWYLGLEAVQQRKVGAARDYWQRLIALLPADGEEHKNVAAALDTLDKAERAAKEAAPK